MIFLEAAAIYWDVLGYHDPDRRGCFLYTFSHLQPSFRFAQLWISSSAITISEHWILIYPEQCSNVYWHSCCCCSANLSYCHQTALDANYWQGMEDDFSLFHSGNFLPFHTKTFFLISFWIYFHTKELLGWKQCWHLCNVQHTFASDWQSFAKVQWCT